MKKLKIGFVGVGFIAQQCHLPAFREQPNVEIVAIADPYEDLARKIKSIYQVPKIYSNHKELLKDKEIDAVIITLPRFLTYGVVKDCLESCKHVFTEKPLSLNHRNAEKLRAIAKKNNLILHVGYMKRYDHGLQEFKKIIKKKYANGSIPKLIKASCYMGDSYGSPFGSFKSFQEPSSVKLFKETFPNFLSATDRTGYENFINTYSHVLDSLDFLFESKLMLLNSHIDDNGYGITLFDLNGVPTELSTSKILVNKWFEEIKVIFEDEIYTIEFPPALLKNVPAQISVEKGLNHYKNNSYRPKWSWSFLNQAKFFTKKVLSNNPDDSSLDSAVQCLELSAEIFKKRRRK